jgi:hypothetical protein
MNTIETIGAKSQLAHGERHERKLSPFGHLFRFIGWWFGLSALYATFAVCPFCGQQGCPVGWASAGTVGVFLTLCLQDWKLFFRFIKQKLTNEKKQKDI